MSSLLVGLITSPTVSAHATQRSGKTPHATLTCAQPPAHVDLTTFSNAQLAVYGLPSRSRFQGRMALWHKLLQHAKHRYCGSGIPTHIRASVSTPGDMLNTANWAGNVAYNRGYNEVDSSWTVPCISNSSYKPADSSQWVGLGGEKQLYPNQGTYYHTLVQDGTESGITSYGFEYYFAWYEDVPYDAGEVRLPPDRYPVYCADSMYVALDSNVTNPRYVTYFIQDMSTNFYYTHREGDGSYSWLPDGTTAEWVIERPGMCLNCPLYPLADFSPTEAYFSLAHTVQSEVGLYVGQTIHDSVYMYSNDGSRLLANPLPISSDGTSFGVNFDASQ